MDVHQNAEAKRSAQDRGFVFFGLEDVEKGAQNEAEAHHEKAVGQGRVKEVAFGLPDVGGEAGEHPASKGTPNRFDDGDSKVVPYGEAEPAAEDSERKSDFTLKCIV